MEFAADLKAAIAQATGEHLTVLYQQAAILQQQGDLDAAEAKLQELLAVQPGHAEARALLTEISRQRESQQRYQQLVSQVKQVRLKLPSYARWIPRWMIRPGVLSLLSTVQQTASGAACCFRSISFYEE